MPALAFLCLVSQSLGMGRPLLQPYEVRSPSGAWTLAVQPTTPKGDGPMGVRLARDGAVSWSGEFPWTFERAGVADDGTWVGYANQGRLRIAVVDARGVMRRQHGFEHTGGILDGPLLPLARGPVLVHGAADLALIRVDEEPLERLVWWAFRLSTGAATTAFLPEAWSSAHEFDGEAWAVGDTGLTLVHGWLGDSWPEGMGWRPGRSVFTLHDLQGKTVWSQGLQAVEPRPNAFDAELSQSLASMPFASVGPGDRFTLLQLREQARVEYAVERDAGGAWTVEETGRAAWEPPRLERTAVAPLELERMAVIRLRDGLEAPSAVHDVAALAFTASGELELVRWDRRSSPTFARLRLDGTLLFERDLGSALPDGARELAFFALGGERWLIQTFALAPHWITVDVRTGAAAAAPLPQGQRGCRVAPLADGEYLALVNGEEDSKPFVELDLVHADGTLGWHYRVLGPGGGSALDRGLARARGLARTGEDAFTLLCREALVRFDLKGNVLASWELSTLIRRDPETLDGLVCDPRGGVVFRAGDGVERVDVAGNRAPIPLYPQRADGTRDPSLLRFLCVAPSGELWTSDGQRVYRLDRQGLGERVLGDEVREDALIAATEGAVDALGRVLVQDTASFSLHLFDADGRRLAVCPLAPEERPRRTADTPFASERDGGLWVKRRVGWAHFDSRGTRLGTSPDGPQPKRTAQEQALDGMQKQPDGRWLAVVRARALLPDGQRVLLTAEAQDGSPSALHRFAATGEPLRSIALPGNMAYWQASIGPRWIVAGDYGPSWVLVRLEDDRVFRFEPKPEDAASWHIGQTPDGKTLLLLNARRLELARYELP